MLFISLLSCEEHVILNLGSKYSLDYDRNGYYTVFSDDNYKVDGNRSIFIEGDIYKFNYDSTFVIALVRPVYKISDSIRKIEGDLNYEEMQILIQRSSMKEYWILNKKINQELIRNKYGYSNSNVYGPFNKNEFNSKRKQLGVSDTLKLLPIEKFDR